jgi:hypothetical protein
MQDTAAGLRESRNGDGSLLEDFKWWIEDFKRDRNSKRDELFKWDPKIAPGESWGGAKMGPALR